ncbi:MAG: cytochrome C oxidase subunit II, partial [Treponema sp.]|nr:cytochrome C oxidase subunit II [Treponema sp.]
DERLDEGLEEYSDAELIINKLEKAGEIADDDSGARHARSKRYSLIAREILDRLKDSRAEIDPSEYDQLSVRENLKKILDHEHIRDRGFNTIVNSLSAALENARLGFQYMENYKNSREILIREYDDPGELPDEHYQIRMRYYDSAQLQEARKAYDTQMQGFETEILHAADILHVIYEDSKSPFKVSDFKDLALKMKDRIRKLKGKNGGPLYEDIEKPWDGLSFVKTGETEVEQMNRTYAWEKERLSARLSLMREMIQNLYGEFDYPPERRSLEEQLNFLEREYNRFDYQINPYHLQPGLTLEVDVTSIKRKRVTLDAMSKAINEFLQGAIKTFQEAAFPTRSNQTGGGGQSFGDLFSSVSAGTLNLSGPDSADYLEDSENLPKTPPKKRASRKRPPNPEPESDLDTDPDTAGGDIREI